MFAGAFLLPLKKFSEDFRGIFKISNPDSYIELKRKWCVSIQAIAYRAQSLQLISYQQYRYFNILLNRLKYKEIEPLDKELPVAKPGKMKSILQLLFERNYLSLEELLQLMEVEIGFLTNLTGIDRNFFMQYHVHKPHVFTVRDLEFRAK